MSNRPAKPANMPRISPYLTVQDCDKAIKFYQEAFGFELKGDPTKSEDGNTVHAELTFNEGVVMVGKEGAWGGNEIKAPATSGVYTPVGLYVYVDDVDQQFKRAKEFGATVKREPEDTFWGDRMCNVLDPDGHSWSFATNVADCDPSKAPGKS